MFIKLHRTEDNKPMYINVDYIESIVEKDVESTTYIYTKDSEHLFSVKETPKEIITLVEAKELNKLYRLQDSIRQLMEQASINVRVI